MDKLEVLVNKYLFHCEFEEGLDLKTVKAYRIDLKQFLSFLQVNNYWGSKDGIQEYIVFLHKNYKVKSIKRKIATLKAFYNYLEFEELIAINPFSKIRIKLHEPAVLPRTVSLSTVDRLLKAAYCEKASLNSNRQCYIASLRDIAVLEMLFATGIRVSELCSLHREDVILENGTVIIYGKGSKERIIHIGNSVLEAVMAYYEAYINQIESTGYFFVNCRGTQLSDQSVRNIIKKYCTLAGIDQHITPHMFRHTFATLLLEEDVDIRYIQHMLGHSSITTTQIYTHVNLSKQRDILMTKHPRNKLDFH